MAETVAITDLQGGVRLITLNRPEKKNALTGAMYDAMRAALAEADASEAVGAVVFAGQPGMFSAGNDLADFMGHAENGFSASPALAFIRQLARTRTPMVAAVDGIAVGIGATLCLHCDLVYASPRPGCACPSWSSASCRRRRRATFCPCGSGGSGPPSCCSCRGRSTPTRPRRSAS